MGDIHVGDLCIALSERKGNATGKTLISAGNVGLVMSAGLCHEPRCPNCQRGIDCFVLDFGIRIPGHFERHEIIKISPDADTIRETETEELAC